MDAEHAEIAQGMLDRATTNASRMLGHPSGEDVQTDIYDAICNFHHLADAHGIDWDFLLGMADFHYQAEIKGEL